MKNNTNFSFFTNNVASINNIIFRFQKPKIFWNFMLVPRIGTLILLSPLQQNENFLLFKVICACTLLIQLSDQKITFLCTSFTLYMEVTYIYVLKTDETHFETMLDEILWDQKLCLEETSRYEKNICLVLLPVYETKRDFMRLILAISFSLVWSPKHL